MMIFKIYYSILTIVNIYKTNHKSFKACSNVLEITFNTLFFFDLR